MKLLVDAQLPKKLVMFFREQGCDAVHTLGLPEGNYTSDINVMDYADKQQRIVVTKDADFVNSFLLKKQPERLFLISTGNITNADLRVLLATHWPALQDALQQFNFIELTRTSIIIHE